jgi:hypothetical protein
LRCPVCKADNSQAPACRRCKADLSLLWELESRRARLLSSARRHFDRGDWHSASRDATAASRLRATADATQLLALARLFVRDFGGAWRAYAHGHVRAAQEMS